MASDALDHGKHLMFDGEQKVMDAAPSDHDIPWDIPEPSTPVTETPGVNFDAYTVNAFPVTVAPSLLVGFDPKRKRVMFRNEGANSVVIGKLSTVQGGRGYILPPNGEFETEVIGSIYGATAYAGTTINGICVWVETYP